MKKSKHRGSLATLLTKNYLAFTTVLILIFAGIYWIWNTWSTEKLVFPDMGGLIESAAFQSGKYSSIEAAKYLGTNGAFSVLDEEINVLYQSADALPHIKTKDEFQCIPAYDADYYIDSIEFKTAGGQTRTLLIRRDFKDFETTNTDILLLDENLKVLEGEFESGKTRYTQTEISYLTGNWSSQCQLIRYSTITAEGLPITVLFCLPEFSQDSYNRIMMEMNRIWLLVLPLYIVVALIFISGLNRHIRQPLQKLNEAIVRLGAGGTANATDCGGPEEIQALGRSFDEMAYKLAESEQERRELEQQRQKMLTDISHDLKTPVTVISGYR